MKTQFEFKYSTQVINPKGKLVYEYNPLYNYRTSGRNVLSKDAEGRILDKNRNVLHEANGKYYYTYLGLEIESEPEILEDGMLLDLVTGGTAINDQSEKDIDKLDDVLNFDLNHPVNIECLQSYDGSVNLILNDGKNIPRLINTRFTPKENNTYERVDRKGNTDTNIYDYDEFDIDSSLFKRYNSIPTITFLNVSLGGDLKVGNYTFYFKLADGDGNETDFIGESGVISIYIGALNSPKSIRGGSSNENGNKSIAFTVSNIDSAYDYVVVYYTRNSGDGSVGTFNTTAHRIDKKYRTYAGNCSIIITGDEDISDITLAEINTEHFVAKTAKTQAVCQNMLFLGNVTKADVNYTELQKLSLHFFPFYERFESEKLIGNLLYDYTDPTGLYEYYNVQNIYNNVGYWPEEIYRFGVVYIMNDNTLSPVFNIRGIKNLPKLEYNDSNEPYIHTYTMRNYVIDYDTNLINETTLENSAGVVLFPSANIGGENKIGNLPVFGIRILYEDYDVDSEEYVFGKETSILDTLKTLNVKGYFFVRLKRIPTILALAFTMGVDKVAGIPLIFEGNKDGKDYYAVETFVTSLGKLEGEFDERIITVENVPRDVRTAICPEFEINLAYYNNFFTGETFTVKPITESLDVCVDGRHFSYVWDLSLKGTKIDNGKDDGEFSTCNIVGVPDFILAVRNDDFTFRGRAGNPEDITYEYVEKEEGDKNIPIEDNFSHEKREKHSWLKVFKWVGIGVAVAALAVASVFTAGAAAVAAGGVAASVGASAAIGAASLVGAGAAATALTAGAALGIGLGTMSITGMALAGAVAMKDSYSKGTGNYTDNRVKIVRGAFSAYLGLTKNTQLKPNQLLNIYIPGYLTSSTRTLFDIRINDESAYYPISYRYQIGRDDNKSDLETLFRGDCYICNFTHRINRNFLDPDAPNNDKIVDINTWIEHWDKDKKLASEVNRGDVNAIKMGSWITLKCYSSYNLSLRDVNHSLPEEEGLTGHKRTFYPLSSMCVHGNYKVPDSTCYNAGFNVSTGNKWNFILPNVPFIKNTYQTRIMYSHPAAVDSFKNGFREFDTSAYRDYPNLYGGLMKLVSWGGNLVAIFEHGISVIPVNEKALIPTDDGTQIAVGAVKVLPLNINMLTDMYGTLWPESVICSESYIYGIDTVAKKIWRTNGALFELISDFRVLEFLNNYITLGERELTPIIGVRNVKSHFNAYKHDIMFTFYDNLKGFEECAWNLCYNEFLNAFVTFYSWIPSYSANIDNIFFTFNRNVSKWIAKLGTSNGVSSSADGVVLSKILKDSNDDTYDEEINYDPTSRTLSPEELAFVNIDNWIIDERGKRRMYLDLSNRYIPEGRLIKTFTLNRDNFRNDKYFKIEHDDTVDCDYLSIDLVSYYKLLNKIVSTEPQIPVVLLNISCYATIQTDLQSTSSGEILSWERYFSYNLGNYQSLVAITFDKILNRQESYTIIDGKLYYYPKLRTDFWKHGLAGIIDIQDQIKPCFWYGLQHPFEFEFIVGNLTADYKLFTNMELLTNNVKPESIHYEIIGDSYAFSEDKMNIYFRLEATKALYLYHGSDILYDHKVFDTKYGYMPKLVYSSNYIEQTDSGLYLRDKSAVSSIYKATLLPLIYSRLDTFNEIEDYYRQIVAPNNKDYPNITGAEIIKQYSLNKYSICNHVKFRDIKEVGRMRGNAQYINDKWEVLISPINTYYKNEFWTNNVPPLLINNVPDDVTNLNFNEFPDELNGNLDYIIGLTLSTIVNDNVVKCGYNELCLDKTPWEKIANSRKEIKLMDRYMKTKIRYKGDKLVLISAINTIYNSMI